MVRTVVAAAILSIISVVGISGMSNLHTNRDYINITEHPGELCLRTCVENEKMICYYEFVMENYQAMGVACGTCAQGNVDDCNNPQCIVGDGTEKGLMSINRQLPGPAIQVCQGDTVIVDVVNKAHGSASSIHWHGMHMKDTPFMDGVPYVTQCPNLYGSIFRYLFTAVEPGTHFYHSHSGHHKINGQYGALIVREPEEYVASINEYDYDLPEHYLLISDWMHSYGEQQFPGLPSTSTGPDSLLINGRGTYINPQTLEHTNVTVIKFFVRAGMKYRFRLVNSISSSFPVQLQIQSHSFEVICSDSIDTEPFTIDSLVSSAGERYDFVITANHSEGDFWIRTRPLGPRNPMEAFALLRYETDDAESDYKREQPIFPDYNDIYPSGRLLNHPTATCAHGTDNSCVTELSALQNDEELRTKEPDHQLYVAFNNIRVPNSEIFQPGSYPHFQNPASSRTFVGAINNISIVFPSSPPLTQPLDIEKSIFCNDMNLPSHCVGKLYCPCCNKMDIELNTIVELVVIDESFTTGSLHHPFHLHGYSFMVMGVGHHPLGLPMTLSAAKQIEKTVGLTRNYKNNPPFKDTVSIPNRGYAILRFRADNPGYWLMHCHYEWHLASGMGVIIQVGNQDQMVNAPDDFPKCKNYMPNVKMPNY